MYVCIRNRTRLPSAARPRPATDTVARDRRVVTGCQSLRCELGAALMKHEGVCWQVRTTWPGARVGGRAGESPAHSSVRMHAGSSFRGVSGASVPQPCPLQKIAASCRKLRGSPLHLGAPRISRRLLLRLRHLRRLRRIRRRRICLCLGLPGRLELRLRRRRLAYRSIV